MCHVPVVELQQQFVSTIQNDILCYPIIITYTH